MLAKIKITGLAALLCAGLHLHAQRISAPAVPVSWTDREAKDELHDDFLLPRIIPYGTIDYKAYRQAVDMKMQDENQASRGGAIPLWLEAGPYNVGGRLTDVEMPANSLTTIYACAASGGIYKSDDAGSTWYQIFDQQPTQSIGDLAIAPSDPSVLYVGTGEANSGGGSLTYDGRGVFRSNDGGLSWSYTGLDSTRNTGRVAIHPTNPDIAFAATMGDLFSNTTERGLYRTTDGGTSWQKVLYVNDSTGVIDVAIDPMHPDTVYACSMTRVRRIDRRNYGGPDAGLWKSTDGGTTWNRLTRDLPSDSVTTAGFTTGSTTITVSSTFGLYVGLSLSEDAVIAPNTVITAISGNVLTLSNPTVGPVSPGGLIHFTGKLGRTCIGISPTQPNILYYLTSDENSSFTGVYKSYDYGDHWTHLIDSTVGDVFNGASHWEGRLKVDPTDPNTVYISGFNTYKSVDGGQSWFSVTDTYHPDNHEIYISPLDPNFLLIANDGGLFSSNDAGNNWNHFTNLPITQFYTCEVNEQNPSSLAGGAQDNGVNLTYTGLLDDWSQIWGGDGFGVLIDPNDSTTYMESQYGYINTGNSGVDPNDRFNWNTPLEFNHQNTHSLFMGADRLYKSTDQGASWNAVSPDLTNHQLSGYPITWGTITSVACAATDSSVIYCGTDDGQVWVTQDNGSNWTNINPTTAVRWVTRVTVDPHDAGIVYTTLSGYRFHDPVAHVYRSIDFGNTWQAIDGNLPDIPCNDILPDPDMDSTLYLATDAGVYYSLNLGTSWNPLGIGLPVVPVTDLRLHNPTRKLVAATYGRSMYSINVDVLFVNVPSITDEAVREFSVFPNPVSGQSVFQYYSGNQSIGMIEITDISGRIIHALPVQIEKGINRITLASMLPAYTSAGIYFLRLSCGNNQYTTKLVVTRSF